MQISIDIPESHLALLTAIAEAKDVPRAQVIGEAVAAYIEAQRESINAAFGIWKGVEDGLEYQRRMRDEWEDR